MDRNAGQDRHDVIDSIGTGHAKMDAIRQRNLDGCGRHTRADRHLAESLNLGSLDRVAGRWASRFFQR